MELDRSSWFVRWFLWSVGIWDTFRDRSQEYNIRRTGTTNLCFFFRTTLVSVPLVILLHVVVYGMAVLSLTWGPIYFFGSTGYFSVVGAVVTVFCLILLIKKLITVSPEEKRRKREQWDKKVNEVKGWFKSEETQTQHPASPSFFDAVSRWIHAIHEKICPVVILNKKEVR